MSSKSKKGVKKLVSVLATSTAVTKTREKTIETAKAVETTGAGKDDEKSKGEYPEDFARVLCIWYPINFWKKSVPVSVLIDSGSKVNAIYLTFVKELGLPIRLIDVGAQKIDGTMLNTFEIVVVAFLVMDKSNQVRFFKKTFLVANVNLEVVLEIFFFILSDTNVNFLGRKLCWRTYTTKKALPTTRCVKLVGKKKFVAIVLNLEYKTYVVHVESVSSNTSPSYFPLNLHLFLRL